MLLIRARRALRSISDGPKPRDLLVVGRRRTSSTHPRTPTANRIATVSFEPRRSPRTGQAKQWALRRLIFLEPLMRLAEVPDPVHQSRWGAPFGQPLYRDHCGQANLDAPCDLNPGSKKRQVGCSRQSGRRGKNPTGPELTKAVRFASPAFVVVVN